MEKEGKYIYCIIGTKLERNFGPIGIGGRGDEVCSVGYGDLSMVVSASPITRYTVSREHVLAHERVVEEVMKEFTVLPVRFCTIASGEDKIRNLLDRRRREFKNLLRDIDYKVELNLRAIWKDMDMVFKEILEENREIKGLKENIRNTGKTNTQTMLEIGRMVEHALKIKKEQESESVASVLKKVASDYRINRNSDNKMFLNAAFLADKGREKEFDNLIDDLGERYKDRVKFMYTGPFPPYNFATITLHPEEWEK